MAESSSILRCFLAEGGDADEGDDDERWKEDEERKKGRVIEIKGANKLKLKAIRVRAGTFPPSFLLPQHTSSQPVRSIILLVHIAELSCIGKEGCEKYWVSRRILATGVHFPLCLSPFPSSLPPFLSPHSWVSVDRVTRLEPLLLYV